MIITDTHPLVWYSTGHHSLLSAKALKAFKRAEEGRSVIYIPSVVLWETGLLLRKGSITLPDRLSHWANTLLNKSGFVREEFDLNTIATAIGFNFNGDPFDNIIVAMAMEMELPLITKDVAITESNLVEVYW